MCIVPSGQPAGAKGTWAIWRRARDVVAVEHAARPVQRAVLRGAVAVVQAAVPVLLVLDGLLDEGLQYVLQRDHP